MGRGHGTGTERRLQPQPRGAGCTSGAAGAPCCLVAPGTCTGVMRARRRVVPTPMGMTCVCTRTRGQCEHPHSRTSLHGAISPSHLSPPSSSPPFFPKKRYNYGSFHGNKRASPALLCHVLDRVVTATAGRHACTQHARGGRHACNTPRVCRERTARPGRTTAACEDVRATGV